MKLKQLEYALSGCAGFEKPKIKLEQYVTPAEIAAAMLNAAAESFDDLNEHSVVIDLGCGCGVLAIGAHLLGAGVVVGVDVDDDALRTAERNRRRVVDKQDDDDSDDNGDDDDNDNDDDDDDDGTGDDDDDDRLKQKEGADGDNDSDNDRRRRLFFVKSNVKGITRDAIARLVVHAEQQQRANDAAQKKTTAERGKKRVEEKEEGEVDDDDDNDDDDDDNDNDNDDNDNDNDNDDEEDEDEEDDDDDDGADAGSDVDIADVLASISLDDRDAFSTSVRALLSSTVGATASNDSERKPHFVVLMNPPFGTKKNAGEDWQFVETALSLARDPPPALSASKIVVYSLHKTSTRDFFHKRAKVLGFDAQVVAELRYNLPATYQFHKKKEVNIEVDFWRFEQAEQRERNVELEQQRARDAADKRSSAAARKKAAATSGGGGARGGDRKHHRPRRGGK